MPDAFHRNYTLLNSFLEELEAHSSCRFTHSDFTRKFMGKFNMSIYFQLRLQSIVPRFENLLSNHSSQNLDSATHIPVVCSALLEKVHLTSSRALLVSLYSCFETGTFLTSLSNEFVSLSARLIRRFICWCQNFTDSATAALTLLQDLTILKGIIDSHLSQHVVQFVRLSLRVKLSRSGLYPHSFL